MNRLRALAYHVDLWVAALLVLAAMAAVTLNLGTLPRVLLGVPLVLFLPGYALVSALFPTRVIPTVERLLLALGASIALAIVVGLALALAGVLLTPGSWTVALALLTMIGVVVAWVRRLRHGVTGPGFAFVTMPRLSALMVVVAVLGAINIVAGSNLVAQDQASPAPAQLWMVPIPGQPDEAQLGMRAGADGGPYLIRLSSGGTTLREFNVDTAPGQEWVTDVVFPVAVRANPIVARLYYNGSDTEMRFVVLEPATNGG